MVLAQIPDAGAEPPDGPAGPFPTVGLGHLRRRRPPQMGLDTLPHECRHRPPTPARRRPQAIHLGFRELNQEPGHNRRDVGGRLVRQATRLTGPEGRETNP